VPHSLEQICNLKHTAIDAIARQETCHIYIYVKCLQAHVCHSVWNKSAILKHTARHWVLWGILHSMCRSPYAVHAVTEHFGVIETHMSAVQGVSLALQPDSVCVINFA